MPSLAPRKTGLHFILFLLLFLVESTQELSAQAINEITISIQDSEREQLAGATVIGYPGQWVMVSDERGQLTIPIVDSVNISYLGLPDQTFSWQEMLAQEGLLILAATTTALPTVTVSAQIGQRDLSQAKTRISALAIQEAQVSTPAAALEAEAGVFVQMSQLGGGSPIVRGFEANRVLLMVDDIRMNNAIYRNGHLQNAITVDENILSEVAVSFGPGSLPYGSDALGGVVHFKTKDPLPLAYLAPGEHQLHGQTAYRYSSAGNSHNFSGNLSYQSQKWSGITALSLSRFGDLKAGKNHPKGFENFGLRDTYVGRINGQDSVLNNPDTYTQLGSAYEQIDVLQKINFRLHTSWRLQLMLQYSNSGDIPRYDRLTERRDGALRFAEWYYGPQQRLLAAAKLYWTISSTWADQARLVISRQWIGEDRYDRRLQDEWREASLVDVQVNNLTLDFTKRWPQGHLINYGIDGRYDEVDAIAFRQSLLTGEKLQDINSRYPSGGSSLRSAGAYLQYRYSNRDSSLLIENGARINQQQLVVQFSESDPIEWPADYLTGINNNSLAGTWASGISWQPQQWAFRLHLATGFRAPNVDDFAKFRERNGFVQVPNPNLEAEQSLSADLSVGRWMGDNVKLSATIYRTWLRNAIVRQNFQLPSGSNFFLSQMDTFFVQANVNAEQARLWGLDVALNWDLGADFSAKAQVHHTYGRRDFTFADQVVEVPLDHIPPTYGQIDLRYRKNRWTVSARWRFQLQKKLDDYAVSSISEINNQLLFDRSGTSDNLEQTPFDNETQAYLGSYAWSVFHLSGSWKLGQQWRLRAQFNNLFDLHYRTFASGISAPGRDMVVGLYGYF